MKNEIKKIEADEEANIEKMKNNTSIFSLINENNFEDEDEDITEVIDLLKLGENGIMLFKYFKNQNTKLKNKINKQEFIISKQNYLQSILVSKIEKMENEINILIEKQKNDEKIRNIIVESQSRQDSIINTIETENKKMFKIVKKREYDAKNLVYSVKCLEKFQNNNYGVRYSYDTGAKKVIVTIDYVSPYSSMKKDNEKYVIHEFKYIYNKYESFKKMFDSNIDEGKETKAEYLYYTIQQEFYTFFKLLVSYQIDVNGGITYHITNDQKRFDYHIYTSISKGLYKFVYHLIKKGANIILNKKDNSTIKEWGIEYCKNEIIQKEKQNYNRNNEMNANIDFEKTKQILEGTFDETEILCEDDDVESTEYLNLTMEQDVKSLMLKNTKNENIIIKLHSEIKLLEKKIEDVKTDDEFANETIIQDIKKLEEKNKKNELIINRLTKSLNEKLICDSGAKLFEE